jgi:hypothetical protein
VRISGLSIPILKAIVATNDFDFAAQKFFLDPFSMFGIEARVICRCGNETTKFLGQSAGLLSRSRVDDSWPMPGIEHQFTGEFSPLRRRNLDHSMAMFDRRNP